MGKKISISENGVLAGTADLLYSPEKGGSYYVADCPAELGSNSAESEVAYDAIDEAINEGRDSAESEAGDYRWTWTIYDSDD